MIEINKDFLKPQLLSRSNDSNKHDYGHALLVCGSRRMPGAAVLATGAALKSGCGLVTLHTVENAGTAAICQFPSAMLSLEEGDCLASVPQRIDRYSCIGIGPGLGTADCTANALEEILKASKGKPIVLDADALNILAKNRELLDLVPPGSVLTPHDGELKRLLQDWNEGRPGPDEKRPGLEAGRPGPEEGHDKLIEAFCRRYGVILVKKGWRTRIFTPEGEVFENTTGNPGMAKGGSGDVLTGLITGLVARGYNTLTAAKLGVWIHGHAGDVLTAENTAEAYSSSDLIGRLPDGFVELSRN